MLGQIWRFAGVGIFVTLTHVLMAIFANSVLHFPAQVANFTGFVFAVFISYFSHAFFTFRATGDHSQQMPRFVVVALSGLAASSLITFLVHTQMQGTFVQAMVVALFTVPPITFLTSKYWVFNDRHSSSQGPEGVLLSTAIAGAFLCIYWGRSLSHDVAWYLVATRKWLHEGAQLYVDLIEVNPPLNFYLTVPAVLLGDFLKISDTNSQYLVVAILLNFSLIWVWKLLANAPEFTKPRRLFILACSGIAVLLVATSNIAQREHIMLLFILPYIFGYLTLPKPDYGRDAILRAGFAAMGLCLKPFFMLFPIALTLLMILQRKTLKPVLSPANLVILSTGSSYVALTILLHPEYLREIVPLARQVYGAYGHHAAFILLGVHPLTLILFVGISILASRSAKQIDRFDVLIAVVIAATTSYLLQWAGFSYHQVPTEAFLLIACIWIVAHSKLPVPLAATSCLTGAYLIFINLSVGFYHNPDLRVLTRAVANQKTGYSLMVFSDSLGPGFPLALETQANWASRYPGIWLIPGPVNEIAESGCNGDKTRCDNLKEILSQTRKKIIADFAASNADVLIFDHRLQFIWDRSFRFESFLAQDPRYADIIKNYEIKGQSTYFVVMIRKLSP